MDRMSLVLAVRQQGLCPLCKQALIAGAEYEPDSPREWIDWFAASKKVLHSECHRQHHAGDMRSASAARARRSAACSQMSRAWLLLPAVRCSVPRLNPAMTFPASQALVYQCSAPARSPAECNAVP